MLLCALIIGLVAGSAWFVAPSIAAAELDARLKDLAARRGMDLQFDAIYVEPLSRLVLDGVVIRDKEHRDSAALLRVARVEVSYEVHGATAPKVYLHAIKVVSPRLRLHRTADGKSNADSLIASLTGGAAGSDDGKPGGGGGLRKYLSRHVPRLVVQDLAVAIDDDKGRPLITPIGTDMRHMRLRDANLEIADESKVQDVSRFAVKGDTRITGFDERLQVEGQLQWPDRTGWLTVELPGDFALQAKGFRASVGRVTVHSDGRVLLGAVAIEKLPADDSPFALDIRQVGIEMTAEPAPLQAIPPMLRERLPDPIVAALRHIAEITIEHPVIVGKRPSERRQRSKQPAAGGQLLLPKKTRRTDSKGNTSGARTRDPEVDRRARIKAQQQTAKQNAMGEKEAPDTEGKVVREALAGLFARASVKLEKRLGDLLKMAAAIPVRRIRVHHGRARYKDERIDDAKTNEVSDFSASIDRGETGVVVVKLDFGVPGSDGHKNAVSGRVHSGTGDSQVSIRLDRLPITPYAAVMPSRIGLRSDAVIQDTMMTLRYEAKEARVKIDGKTSVKHIDIEAPKISLQPIEDLSFSASGKAVIDLRGDKVAIDAGRIDIDRFQVLYDGAITHFRTAPAFDMAARVPTIQCQDAVDSLVRRFAPNLDGMVCSGTMEFRFSFSLDTAEMRSLKFEFEPVLNQLKIDSLGKYIDFEVLAGPFEHNARQPDGTLYSFVTGPGSERWVPLEEMSENLIKVVTTTEDGLFFGHNGFSIRQIRGAMVANLRKGRFVRGASTISQQTAKNLFFVEREKTISRKVQEAIVTWDMEHRLTKEQIIELYFNIIEFGPRIYGVKAAANHFFRRAPNQLTLLQSIWLGSIVPGPRRFYHQFVRGSSGETWRNYMCWIGRTMHKREKITADQVARLSDCNVVFGGGDDGSEEPDPAGEFGLGYEGDTSLGQPKGPRSAGEGDEAGAAALRKIRAMKMRRAAPSVSPDEQP